MQGAGLQGIQQCGAREHVHVRVHQVRAHLRTAAAAPSHIMYPEVSGSRQYSATSNILFDRGQATFKRVRYG